MSNSNINRIGKRIAELRKSKGLTQEELATRLCITAQAISKWERGIGLPDVTIFPALADALGVSVAFLFGEDTQNEDLAPQTFDDCPLVSTFGTLACYSNKAVSLIDNGKVLFADGSVADFSTRSIQNCGKGEIRIIETEDLPQNISRKSKTMEHKIDIFQSLHLSSSFPCTAEILSSNDGFFGIKASGSPLFISLIDSELAGSTLNVYVRSPHYDIPRERKENNRLFIFIPQDCTKKIIVSVAGSSVVKATTDFEAAEFKITGSGNIEAQSFQHLSTSIAGSGNIYVNNVTESSCISIAGSGDIAANSLGKSTSIKISGSGDVTAQRAENLDVAISGSGDVAIDDVAGNLSCSIKGSGDLACGGTVEHLEIKITGSGDFDGQQLTANEADITISGSGNVNLFRIITRSTERLSKHAKLKVKNRG